MIHRTRVLGALLVLVLLVPIARAQRADYERAYAIELAGSPAGALEVRQVTEGERITTSASMRFELRRGTTGVAIAMASSFVETARGEPIRMTVEQSLGTIPTSTVYEWDDTGITAVASQGGQSVTNRFPLPEGSWLTPAAAAEYVRQRLEAGAETITVRTIEPFNGPSVVTVTRTDFEPATVEVDGEAVAAVRCRVSSSATPGADSVEYLAPDGLPVRSEVNMAGLNVVMTLTDAPEQVRAGEAPELLVSTFVTPSRPIADPRNLRRAVYRLTVEEGAPDVPSTSVQHVRAGDDRSVRVLVDMGQRTAAEPGAAVDPALLAATSTCNHADPEIRALAERVVRGINGPVERAEALRRFVHSYIDAKNLGVGFATASETVRTRSGDCTEHAVLLAAMLRAVGIPSRAAAGLVYADQFAGAREVFAYHMWTQALLPLDGAQTWVDLDATLPDAMPFDATHIALALTDLGDGTAEQAFIRIAPLLGRLSIEVEQTD